MNDAEVETRVLLMEAWYVLHDLVSSGLALDDDFPAEAFTIYERIGERLWPDRDES